MNISKSLITEFSLSHDHDVPVDGDWSPWEAWSPCDADCGGQQIRVRVCNDPRPTNGGLPCPGPQNEIQECNRGNRECPGMVRSMIPSFPLQI